MGSNLRRGFRAGGRLRLGTVGTVLGGLSLLLSACAPPLPFSAPVAAPHKVALKWSWLGFWVQVVKKGAPPICAAVYPFSTRADLVVLYLNLRQPLQAVLVKVWPVTVGGERLMQGEVFSPDAFLTPANARKFNADLSRGKVAYQSAVLRQRLAEAHRTGLLSYYVIGRITLQGGQLIVQPLLVPGNQQAANILPAGGFVGVKAIRTFLKSPAARTLLASHRFTFQRASFRQVEALAKIGSKK